MEYEQLRLNLPSNALNYLLSFLGELQLNNYFEASKSTYNLVVPDILGKYGNV